MKQIKLQTKSWLHLGALRAARLHFVFIALLVTQTVIYDAWKLIAPKALMNRWIAVALLLVITTAVWYVVRSRVRSLLTYKAMLATLILSDIAFASFSVYVQRGMASRAVMLFVIPIILAAVLRSRTALFATATLCAAAYTSTAIAYFVLNFNEGYKIELYGEVGFYSVMFFILASVLWIVVRTTKSPRN